MLVDIPQENGFQNTMCSADFDSPTPQYKPIMD